MAAKITFPCILACTEEITVNTNGLEVCFQKGETYKFLCEEDLAPVQSNMGTVKEE